MTGTVLILIEIIPIMAHIEWTAATRKGAALLAAEGASDVH